MTNKIDWYISKLDQLAVWWIKEDHLHHEFKDVVDTLDSIKKENKKWEPSKEQLNKIIKFLNEQTNTIPNGDFVMLNKLNWYKKDFQELLSQREQESNEIKEESKKDANIIKNELSNKKDNSKWIDPDKVETTNQKEVTKNTTQLQTKSALKFNDTQKSSFESKLDLNKFTEHTVKSGDLLWDIVKNHYKSLGLSRMELINAINYIVDINLKKYPHIVRDNKLARWIRWSDWIRWDNIRVGDILKLPNIKEIESDVIPVVKKDTVQQNNEINEKFNKIKSEVIEKSNWIQDENENKRIKQEIEKCKDTACLENISKKIDLILLEQNVPETSEVANNWQTIGFTKGWENYIIWKDWEPRLITTQELTPEFKKSLEKYQETLVFAENINMLLSALTQSWEDVSKEIIKIQTSINAFNPSKIDESNTSIQSTIKDVFKWLNIDNKEDIKLEDRISVLNYIRDELDNYEFVRKNIVEKQFEWLTKISQEELDKFIKEPTNNQEKIKAILWEEGFIEFQTEIVNKKAEADTYFLKNKEELQKQYPTIDINNIKELITDSFVWTFAKIKISEIYIEKNLTDKKGWVIKDTIYNWKWNEDIDLFADIQGIWDWNISDKNSNFWKEAFILIATEIAAIAAWMLTLWAWAYAVNAMVYGTRFVKYAKLANKSYSSLNMWGKALKVWKFAAMSTVEWWAFYAWYGAVQSWVEWKNMYSKEWLAESIAFMWAFKALNGLYKITWLKIDPSKPLIEQKIILGKQLIWDWVTFSALWLGFEWILFEPGEWTAETIVQAFVMAAAFRWAWVAVEKFKFKPKKDGWVEAVQEVKTQWKNETLKPVNKNILPKDSSLELIWKNWENYLVLTDKNWNIIRLFNETKKVEIYWGWKTAWIKNNIDWLRKKYWPAEQTKTYKWSTEAPIDKNAKPLENWTNKQNKSNETNKQEETINDSQIKELTPKKIDLLFEKHFTKEMNSEWQIQIWEKTYKKRNDWKYERSWDNTLYTKKEILKQISLDDKKIILEKTAKNRVSELEAEKTIKLKDGIFDWKGKYKVSKDEIIIKENWKERKLSKDEETQFYKDHYEEILNKFWFNIKKDSEILVDKIKEKLSWSKWVDMIKSINKFLESIPALWRLYKWGKWIWKQWIDSMLTPVNIVKNIKNAKWFEETLKSIIFANKDIWYIKWVWKVGWMIAIPTIAEIIYETNTTPQWSMSLSPWNIAANYWEMMYLWIINTLIIEWFNIDEWALNETP